MKSLVNKLQMEGACGKACVIEKCNHNENNTSKEL